MTDVKAKVSEWLAKQGFPLEFKTAEIFAKQGFETDQGAYITDPKEGKLREIDVIASSVHQVDGRSYRFSLVTECKWSQDQPWVVFTSRRARPTLSASIAYLLGSPFAEAILWFLAGDRDILERHRKALPIRVGFAGRQAFVDKDKREKELFYPTIQGVVAAAMAFTRDDARLPSSLSDIVRDVHIAIPTIVLDGSLFEAYLEGEHLKLEPLTEATVSWRGFGVRRQPVFVNIVTVDALAGYAERYANYGENLRHWAKPLTDQVGKAVLSKDGRDLPTTLAHPTDIVVPWLLTGMV